MQVEPRGGGLRQRNRETRPYTERTLPVSTKLERFTHKARNEPQTRFNALMGMLFDPEGLRDSFERQKEHKAPGVDGVRKEQYGEGLDERLADLSARLRRLGYRPKPVRRTYIPKGDGRYRPLGIPSFEDRLVQDRLSRILQAIWEPEFRECSHGFRPGRSAHGALKQVAEVITNQGTQWVVEADIKGFFDHVSHAHLERFLAHRIADGNLLRIIRRFLKAGILEDGAFTASEEGTPQGGLVSPVLSNLYLHYVLDLWFEARFARSCEGRAHLIRYADDYVALPFTQRQCWYFPAVSLIFEECTHKTRSNEHSPSPSPSKFFAPCFRTMPIQTGHLYPTQYASASTFTTHADARKSAAATRRCVNWSAQGTSSYPPPPRPSLSGNLAALNLPYSILSMYPPLSAMCKGSH